MTKNKTGMQVITVTYEGFTAQFSVLVKEEAQTNPEKPDNNKPNTDNNKPNTDNNKPNTDNNKPNTDNNKPNTDNNKPNTTDKTITVLQTLPQVYQVQQIKIQQI